MIGAGANKEPGDEAISGISISMDRFDEGVVGDGKKQYRFKDGRKTLGGVWGVSLVRFVSVFSWSLLYIYGTVVIPLCLRSL